VSVGLGLLGVRSTLDRVGGPHHDAAGTVTEQMNGTRILVANDQTDVPKTLRKAGAQLRLAPDGRAATRSPGAVRRG
jgi:hypothetical protein